MNPLLGLAQRAIKANFRLPGIGLVQKYEEGSFLIDVLARLRIDCLLDVGANKGQYAQKVRRMGYAGHIISFEPVPADYAILQQAAARDAKWHVLNVALGSVDEQREFNVIGPPGVTVLSSFLEPIRDIMPKEVDSIPVQMRRLDTMLPEIEALTGPSATMFLKMDTQGFDLEVCRGCGDAIGRMAGLQSEISVKPLYENQPHFTGALAEYESLGFALMNLSLVSRTPLGAILEYDCVMARESMLA